MMVQQSVTLKGKKLKQAKCTGMRTMGEKYVVDVYNAMLLGHGWKGI